MGRFVERRDLGKIADRLREEGRTIVLANGTFDLFHVGHLRYLKGAKEQGDVLFVAVNSDRSVKAYKGEDRPIIPESERVEILLALDVVDYVTLFDEPDVTEVIRILKPHIHAKGTDYTPESVPEGELVRSLGGRVVITGDPKDHSTTEILERLRSVICGKD